MKVNGLSREKYPLIKATIMFAGAETILTSERDSFENPSSLVR